MPASRWQLLPAFLFTVVLINLIRHIQSKPTLPESFRVLPAFPSFTDLLNRRTTTSTTTVSPMKQYRSVFKSSCCLIRSELLQLGCLDRIQRVCFMQGIRSSCVCLGVCTVKRYRSMTFRFLADILARLCLDGFLLRLFPSAFNFELLLFFASRKIYSRKRNAHVMHGKE